VVHYGRWWNPAVESQATDRAYRIGQTKDVSVYLPTLRDPSGRVAPSFDERLEALMNRRQRLAEDYLRPLPPQSASSDKAAFRHHDPRINTDATFLAINDLGVAEDTYAAML